MYKNSSLCSETKITKVWQTNITHFFLHKAKIYCICFLYAGEPVEHPQANVLHYMVLYAVSVTAPCIYRVGTVIVKLKVTMPDLQLV